MSKDLFLETRCYGPLLDLDLPQTANGGMEKKGGLSWHWHCSWHPPKWLGNLHCMLVTRSLKNRYYNIAIPPWFVMVGFSKTSW
jgi:hypothetical protein